jgi:hypothetical protein
VTVAAVVALLAAAAYASQSRWVRGWALYSGYLPLTGRIVGHEADMPPEALVCANCHEPGQPGADPRRLPQLDSRLTEVIVRRGGPPVSYDVDSFCALLAGGIDPSTVMISRTMPRFSMSADDCAALWAFVSTRSIQAVPDP